MEQHDTPAGGEKLVSTLAAGATVRQAAKKCGLSERTAYRRLADADFRRAVNEARDRLFEAAVGQLADLTSTATGTLERLMESDKPSEALAAAKAVLEMVPRLRESAESEERISRLEDEADEKIDENQTPAGEEELVEAFATGATAREAAKQAGVEQEAALSRLADAGFRRAVSRARGRLLGTALGQLANLAGRAVGVFERQMESDQPSVARRAAKLVLQLGPRLRETELQERTSRLKEIADEKPDEEPASVIGGNE